MPTGPYKTIKDPVHGYIRVPREFMERFVDTELFQRLRSIEQTSMRCLFPGGRHDRFVHSLGVFHLARRMYESILRNTKEDDAIYEIVSADGLKNAFLVAALMHDCGHSPFSHTFEKFYNKSLFGGSHNSAYEALKGIVDPSAYEEFDFVSGVKKDSPPAHHEVMSAYVLLTSYASQLRACGIDNPTLLARMITGVQHKRSASLQEKVEDVLIGLINGDALDVDKLDYIVRDTWASGVKNTTIDIDRLVESATILRSSEGEGAMVWFAFRKSAISVVQSILDARNYLYEWVYGHHTVLYYTVMLQRAVRDCVLSVAGGDKARADVIMRTLFSHQSFAEPQPLAEELPDRSFQMTDGDMLGLVKRHCPDSPSYRAYAMHVPAHIPVWKTGAEYRLGIDDDHRNRISGEFCAEKIRERFGYTEEQCFACDDLTMKLYDLKGYAVMIQTEEHKAQPLTKLADLPRHPHLEDKTKSSLFYVFIPKEDSARAQEIIDFINKIPLGGK